MIRIISSAYSAIFLFIFFSILFLGNDLSGAGNYTCETNPLIEIVAPDKGMNKSICDASAKATVFLSRYNLRLKHSVKIEIVEETINSNDYIAFGCYNCKLGTIQLMSYPSITKNLQSPQMYDQPFDLEHYQGAIAHEITHAVFHHNSRNIKDQLTNAAQEYLAHSTQLAVLSSTRRESIIAVNDVGPWESGDSISEIYMGLNPTWFAIKSYLHLTQLEDPQPFIRLLLNNNWFYISVP